MKIVYLSVTGQTRKFVNKLNMDSLEINPTNPFVPLYEPFIVIVPSYEKEATEVVDDFMNTANNIQYCKGVAGGGNRNFAQLFGFTAKDFAEDYNVPLLHLFEFQGSVNDVNKIKEEVERIERTEVAE